MASDVKLPVAIFTALVALIAIPFVIDHLRESRRPILLDARVVSATASDPVFREGRRRAGPDEAVDVVLALRIGRRSQAGRWMAPVERLEIGGREVDHLSAAAWPEPGRHLRIFWFSVECANLGGALEPGDAAERLRYRTFLAPEMGRGLRAERLPEIHNDDHIGGQSETASAAAGTFRLYARVELVEAEGDVQPLQAMSTPGVDHIFDEAFPTISRSAELGEGVDPTVGELFGLPGFEPRAGGGDPDEVTLEAFARPFSDLVAGRFAVSSRSLAAVAVTGGPRIDRDALESLGSLVITAETTVRGRRTLSWGTDVLTGDLLVDGEHWRVLLGDDGDGVLGGADAVLHCWGRPPERTTLWTSLETETATVEHLRRGD